MVLESTILCVDNSEFMRNGDFVPTRLQAQQDAVNLIAHSKTRANPENNVGLLTLANSEVLVTLTTDTGKILARLHQVQPDGEMRFLTGIRIAHLALKHRQGKNHRMRIICFVGSPLDADEGALLKLAKRLKKEKVNVDIINFGEENDNTDLLSGFIQQVNGKAGTASHLVNIPSGPHLSDALVSSPIVVGEGGSGAPPPGYEFGVDPNEDPELALALRVSMEEQRQRQEEEARNAGGNEETPADNAARAPADGGEASSEEVLLRQALAMSLDETASSGSDEVSAATVGKKETAATEKKPTAVASIPDFSSMTEEEQIAYAMQISMQADEDEAAASSGGAATEEEEPMEVDHNQKEDEDFSEALTDPEFLQNVLEGLPGVDPQSEEIKKSMEKLKSSSDKDGKKKSGGKDEKSGKREAKEDNQDKSKKTKTEDKKQDGEPKK